MCPKLALAATALSLLAAPAFAANAPPPANAASQSQVTRVQIGQSQQSSPQAQAPQAPPAPPPKATSQQRAEADRQDPLARAAFWGHELENDPRDPEAGVKLAKALREMGRLDEAAATADKVLIIDPNNVEALLEEARAHIAQNQGFFAIDPAERAAAAAPHDWRAQSLLAIALEQAQRDDEALAAHQRALQLAPANASAMSNLAMYYAAHGQTADAEALLRKAVALPTATAQVRQNLALILGLEGHVDEAERLARHDLPPAMVDNNLAYLRAEQAPSTERSWSAVQRAP